MGIIGKSIWKPVKSGALRKKLKACKTSLCECVAEVIQEHMDGHAGLVERFQRMLAPNANQAGIPGHAQQITDKQRGLNEALDMYDDNNCGGGGTPIPVNAREYARRPVPTVADWEKVNGRPMPLTAPSTGPSMLGRIGWGILGVGAAVGAGVLLFVPFDGPVGEYAAGTASVAAFGLAFQ